jgi:hypothetical protein
VTREYITFLLFYNSCTVFPGYFVSGVAGSGSTGGSGCTGGNGVSGTLEGGVSISGLLGPGVVSRLFGWIL